MKLYDVNKTPEERGRTRITMGFANTVRTGLGGHVRQLLTEDSGKMRDKRQ